MGHLRGSVMGWLVFGWGLLQITQQPLKRFLVAIVLFPVNEVADMSGSSQSCRPLDRGLIDGGINLNGKQHCFGQLLLSFEAFFFVLSGSYLIFDPRTPNGVFRENNDQFVVATDRLFDPLWKVFPNFEVFRGIPTEHVVVLQISIQAIHKVLILARIADETGVVLDGRPDQRPDIGDEGVTESCST